jgi:Fe-S cluster biogenesis protein NfuA
VKLGQCIEDLQDVLAAHAGGIELVELKADGTARLRYTGMCTGCMYRPLTTAATVRPFVLAADDVTAVEIEGSRISEEAEARLAEALVQEAPAWRLPSVKPGSSG